MVSNLKSAPRFSSSQYWPLGLAFLIVSTGAHAAPSTYAPKKNRPTSRPASYQLTQPLPGSSVTTSRDLGLPAKPETQISAKASIAGKSIQDQYRQTRIASFGFGIDLTHQVVARSLEAHIDAGASLQTGSSQALFFDEYAPSQGIYVSEAVVRWAPADFFILTGGAVDQGRYDSPIFVDYRSFPAVAEALRTPMGKAYFEVGAEQAIPTSSSLSTHAGDEITTPALFVEQAKLGIDRGHDFQVEGGVGYFTFMNLPRSVAHESRFMGSSVTGATNTGAQFVYGYEGILTTGKANLALTRRALWNANGTFLYNRSAPVGRNTGIHLASSIELVASDRVTLVPKVDLFRNESDSSPGYYNSSDLGHNNRQGFGVGMTLKLPRDNFSIEGKWVNSQLLEPSAFQAEMQFIVFTLRKSYVLL